MKKQAKKLAKAKEKKEKRIPSKDELMNRATKKAINMVKTKLLKGDTSPSIKQKEQIEDKIKKMGPKIKKMAQKQMKAVKAAAVAKLKAAKGAPEEEA